MVVLAVTERNLPLLQFFAPLPIKLQATVTGSANVIPKDISHVVQHANHTGSDGFGWRSTVLWYKRSSFKHSLTLFHHMHYFTDDHVAHRLELFLLRERHTLRFCFRVKTEYLIPHILPKRIRLCDTLVACKLVNDSVDYALSRWR